MSADRLQEWVKSVPLCTFALFSVNSGIHLLMFLFATPVGEYSISPVRVMYHHEYYRLVTSSFLHGGLLHIGMNMMSLLQMGPSLESMFGTIKFLFITLWTALLSNILFVSLSWVMTSLTGTTSWMNQNAVGYSGVLFSYALIECYHAGVSSRSLCGVINVPAKLYPWILLILMQFVLPNISFMGHLCGILVGLLSVYGMLNCFIPSHETCLSIERSRLCGRFASHSNFISSKDYNLVPSSSGSESFLSAIWGGIKWFIWQIWNIIATALFIVGFPVDSCTGYIGGRYAALVNFANAPSSMGGSSLRATSTGSEPSGRQLGGSVGNQSNSGIGSVRRGQVYSALRQTDEKDDEGMRSSGIEV